jgi:antitoxin component of MazEF toxin-antitoxin module
VRLPAAVDEALDLKERDQIDIHAENDRSSAIARPLDRKTRLTRLTEYREWLADDCRFDRPDENERG